MLSDRLHPFSWFTSLFTLCISLQPLLLTGAASAAPSVTIANGTVIGSTAGNVESFRGIPYAQPPTGNLRLRPPRSINASYGTLDATGEPQACPQLLSRAPNTTGLPEAAVELIDALYAVTTSGNAGEDCLTLNVQRPAGTNASSRLPVVFWIYGGAFVFGTTQMYDGSNLIEKSVALGENVVYVAVNYRLGGFGFLAGKEMQQDGATNLGLRDQRKGLEWVAENIAAFGGDPEKVTLWGESAGAASSFDQTILYSGDNTYKGKPLFRAAIMDSGAEQPCNSVTSSKSQHTFDTVVATAGCQGESDKLACLRRLPYDKYLAAANNVPGLFSYRSLDVAYLPKPDPSSAVYPVSPEVAVARGNYARIPFIIGDQEDEGTLFSQSQSNISTTDQLVQYINSIFAGAPPEQVAALVGTYPDNAAAGSPFRTGGFNNEYPQYKRLAAILGDSLFTLQRRIYLDNVSRTQSAWSYLASYSYGTPVLGTFHATDVLALYFNLGPPAVIDSILTYYVSFVNHLDPNSIPNPVAGQKFWPRWTGSNKTLLHINADSNELIKDDFRNASYSYLKQYQSVFRFG